VKLHLDLDPAKGKAFKGEVALGLHLERRRRSIELHAAELRVSRARLETPEGRLRGRVDSHPESETVEVRFDRPIPPGDVTLRLAFAGKLRSDLRGLYAASSDQRSYAFTQLEAADARRFFPCFDEPAMKARFQISVTTATGNTVLSNSPAAKVEPLGGGRKRVQFEPTPPLSTYLLALAVGELEASQPTHCGETEIRVWHVPGKGALTAFALETARETLARLETYFDLAYPYQKLDLVAVPDFEAGAMENAGAVFFRETLLLVDPETVTLQEKKRVAEVICHELAHMWYGDLVTMAWWNDLWLNEAFATWMAFHVVHAWKPEWRMWQDFQHHRSAALGMDALRHSHPIYTEVRSPDEATQNFDLITYEKGASVVRMIERYLGAETFRAGVRTYLRRHRESNTVAADLWRALSEVSDQEVEPIVRAWIEQQGFPLLRIRRVERDGQTLLRFRQERFEASPASRNAARQTSARKQQSSRWPIPWVGRVARAGRRGTGTERQLIRRLRDELVLEGEPIRFVYGNADEGGFFHPLHDPEELRLLAEESETLSAVERMGLLAHQWAIVRAGRAKLGAFLDLAVAFGKERDPDVLTTLRAPLGFIRRHVAAPLGEETEGALMRRIVEAFGNAFATLGWDPARNEGDEIRLRRAALLALVGEVAESEPVLRAATERCGAYLDDRRSLDPNLADGVVSLAARRGDANLFERFLEAAKAAGTPQEQRRFLMALGEFQQPDLVKRALSLSLTDAVGTQDVAILLSRMLGNRAAGEQTWDFIKKRWAGLRRRMPPMLITRPIEATPQLGSLAARRDVASFFRANPVPTGARAVRQALEKFDLNLELQTRAAPALRRWLAGARTQRRRSHDDDRNRGQGTDAG
jgi:puromycin-sensitive aminopeptidase